MSDFKDSPCNRCAANDPGFGCVRMTACPYEDEIRKNNIRRVRKAKTEVKDSTKPIIRHCRNCKWAKECTSDRYISCSVKYKYIYGRSQRLRGLLCRFFTSKY